MPPMRRALEGESAHTRNRRPGQMSHIPNVTPTVLERLARSNAAQWGTHIRRRNRKCSGDAVAPLCLLAAAIRALAT